MAVSVNRVGAVTDDAWDRSGPAGQISIAKRQALLLGAGLPAALSPEGNLMVAIAEGSVSVEGLESILTGVALASLSRTATATSPDLTRVDGAKGVALDLSVTTNPGSARTLQLRIDAKMQETASWRTLALFTASAAPKLYLLYPTIGTLAGDVSGTVNAPITQHWRALVIPSDATAWVYALNYEYLF
jgi:hypothetical protein